MSGRSIYITDSDMARLRELINSAREFGKEDEKYLRELEKELDRGKVIKTKDIPPNIITMHSEVFLRDMDSNEEIIYRLVFPEHADPGRGWVSILTPIGTALIGFKVGDVIEWEVPAGITKLKVEKILYQPEAAGDHS